MGVLKERRATDGQRLVDNLGQSQQVVTHPIGEPGLKETGKYLLVGKV